MLARALSIPSNLLVLDEPTNDLDLDTLDLLQEMVADYPGTVILVSHDRDFLDRTVTSVLAAEGDGRWVEYAGGYSDMVSQRGAGVQARAVAAAPARGGKGRASPTAAAGRRKLSFKEKHALETLPARIEALQGDVARLQRNLADPARFSRDPEGFSRSAAELARAEEALAAAEEEWLALEILREEVEG
jgi:ATP-binding cassette subfamily F protein uup